MAGYASVSGGGLSPASARLGPSTSSGGPSGSSGYSGYGGDGSSTPRFGAGTGLGGIGKGGSSSSVGLDARPQIKRQESAPPGMNGSDSTSSTTSVGTTGTLSGSAAGLARAAEKVNGSHAQLHASTIGGASASSSGTGSGVGVNVSTGGGTPVKGNVVGIGSLQPSRPAPPRPLLTANRPAPPAPVPHPHQVHPMAKSPSLPGQQDIHGGAHAHTHTHTPTSAELLARTKAHGPPSETRTAKPPGLGGLSADGLPTRGEASLGGVGSGIGIGRNEGGGIVRAEGGLEKSPSGPRPNLSIGAAGAKSSPAVTGVGSGSVKPLQPVKKPVPAISATATIEKTHAQQQKVVHQQQHQHQQQQQQVVAPTVKVTAAPNDGGVAAAAAALEKPKEKEKRISTMSEAQIMEKLRSVVSKQDPKALYSKIRKVGQG